MLSKKELRPQINFEKSINAIESFQNEVLRPILKLQNDAISLVFNHYLNIYLANKDQEYRRQEIWNRLKKEIQLKNQLLGLVIGHLEKGELVFYLANEKELSKRINGMLIKKITESYEQ